MAEPRPIYLRTLVGRPAWEQLPAGPLQGATWTFWTAGKKVGALHGDRACHSLRDSAVTPQEVPLGEAETLGGLDWPVRTHCDIPAHQQQPGRDYLADSQRVAGWIEVEQKVSAALDATDFRHGSGPSGPWNWKVLALAAHGLGSSEHLARIADETLRNKAIQVFESLQESARRLRTLLIGTGRSNQYGEAGRTALYRMCALELVRAQYDGRDPGPLWEQFRAAGWAAVDAVLEVMPEPEAKTDKPQVDVSGTNADSTPPAGPADRPLFVPDVDRILDRLNRDAHTPLRHVFFTGGQESWPYHRSHDLQADPTTPWQQTFVEWERGSSFSAIGNLYAREDLLRPGLMPRVLVALAAADNAWLAFLDGMAAGGGATHLVAFKTKQVQRALSLESWLLPASLLSFPTAEAARPSDAHASNGLVLIAVPDLVMACLRDPVVNVATYQHVGQQQMDEIAERLSALPDPTDPVLVRSALTSLLPSSLRPRRGYRSLREMLANDEDE